MMPGAQPIQQVEWSLVPNDLIRYAWVSGDINPIHFDEKAAKDLGLPTVIAHGLFVQSRITAELNFAATAQNLGSLKKSQTKFSTMMPCPGTYQIQIFQPSSTTLVGRVINSEGAVCVEVSADTI